MPGSQHRGASHPVDFLQPPVAVEGFPLRQPVVKHFPRQRNRRRLQPGAPRYRHRVDALRQSVHNPPEGKRRLFGQARQIGGRAGQQRRQPIPGRIRQFAQLHRPGNLQRRRAGTGVNRRQPQRAGRQQRRVRRTMPGNLGVPVAHHQPEGVPKRLNRRKDHVSGQRPGIGQWAGEGDGNSAVGNGGPPLSVIGLCANDTPKAFRTARLTRPCGTRRSAARTPG